MAQKLNICVIGGTGFVGHSLLAALTKAGHSIRVLTRRRERHRDLLVLPTLNLVQGDVHDLAFLRSQFQRMDAVIYLSGILNQSRKPKRSFRDVHLELPRKIMEAISQTSARRYLHMSALGASDTGPSEYLRTKGEAEDLVHGMAETIGCAVTSFRPSVIFGPDDSFTNRFAALLRSIPFALPLACPESRFQPVFVDDVTACFVSALTDHDCYAQRYDLCGPKSYTLYEIVEYIDRILGTNKHIIPLADWQARLQAAVFEFLPGKIFTRDNYRSLQLPSVCSGAFPEVFNIEPRAMEQVVPHYLRPHREHLDDIRTLAGR